MYIYNRKLKEHMEKIKICGIYKITCIITNKNYIGQSTNIEGRFKSYKSLKCKEQRLIYQSLIDYGVNNHNMEIIEEINEQTNLKDKLNERELYWTSYYKAYVGDGGLVLRPGGEHGFMADDIKKNMSKSKYNSPYYKALIRKQTSISQQAQSISKIHKNIICYNLDGTIHNKYNSASEIIHKLLKPQNKKCNTGDIIFNCNGKYLTCQGYIFQFEDNDNIQDILYKISKEKYRNNIKPIYQYDLNNKFIESYKSSYEVEKLNPNFKSTDIRACCNNKQKTSHGYKWSYKSPIELLSNLSNIESQLIPYLNIRQYEYREKIIPKEWFFKFTTEELKTIVDHLFTFLYTIQPAFPLSQILNDNFNDHKKVIQDIQKIDINKMYNNNIFKNSGYNTGNSFLKSNFESYWKSSYKGNLSPVDYWLDKSTLKKIIEYRIGINKIRETFDFSLYEIVKGISAIRGTISFFKPTLAYTIYKHFIGNKKNPIVIDPCAGFGGRMLGFKAAYPDGTYIGIEPNIETYNELKKLSSKCNFDKVYLYNCKAEEYNKIKECDLTFTSIPYYNRETYSENIVEKEYSDINDWSDKFITNGLLTYNNVLLNIPYDLKNYIPQIQINQEYTFKNNVARHLNKNSNNKDELILKLF